MGDRIAVMNDGRLEQVGTPEELYERPANRSSPASSARPAMSFAPAEPARARARRARRGDRRRAARARAPVAGRRRPGRPARRRGRVRRGARARDVPRRPPRRGRGWSCASRAAPPAQPGDRVRFGLVRDGLRFFDPESGRARLRPAAGYPRTRAEHRTRGRHPGLPRPDLRRARDAARPRRGALRRRALRSPGGGAITAVAAARLGLETALVAPLGADLGGEYVRRELEDEGVAVAGFRTKRTPETVVMPVGEERTMVTVDPGIRARAADVAALTPVAIAANLDQLDLLPERDALLPDLRRRRRARVRGPAPAQPVGARALFLNARTRSCSPAPTRPRRPPRSRRLGRDRRHHARRRARDRGGRRAAASRCPTSTTGPVVDTTGDRDLLCAAYAWADLRGARRRRAPQLGAALLAARDGRADRHRRRGLRGAAARGGGEARPRQAVALTARADGHPGRHRGRRRDRGGLRAAAGRGVGGEEARR